MNAERPSPNRGHDHLHSIMSPNRSVEDFQKLSAKWPEDAFWAKAKHPGSWFSSAARAALCRVFQTGAIAEYIPRSTRPVPLKVGFGPRTNWNSFYQSGERVAELLDLDPRFEYGFFGREPFSLEELSRYDVLVVIKHYPPLDILAELKRRGKVLILDWHDRALYPSFYERNLARKFLISRSKAEANVKKSLRIFDRCFVASPVIFDAALSIGARPHFLQRQLFNHGNEFNYKIANGKKDRLVIYWTGIGENQKQNEAILPVLRRLHDEFHCRIVYSSDAKGDVPFVEYRTWNRDAWEEELVQADVAFRWRDDSEAQRLKDANKVMAYMAAGLPVVSNPTASEKLVMEDGVTGMMAYSSAEFEQKMVELITHPGLRALIGNAAHDAMWSRYSLRQQVEDIKGVLLDLAENKVSR